MSIFILIVLPLLGAALAPTLGRRGRNVTAGGVALATGIALAWLLTLAPRVFGGEVIRAGWVWLPELGINITFRIDGLALLFGFLIFGIGLLIILYARYYLSASDNFGRFFAYLMLFMTSMLGIVLSENILLLLVFWELTSLSSFLLIAFYHWRYESRSGAITALTVTGGGGLALLGGFLLLGHAAGSYEISDILASREAIVGSPLYPAILLLVLLGAFTKSAQFPFHFWLPHAMAAPTPVSAYLHSATMVKAGIFLMARFHPALAGTLEWSYIVTATGLVTLMFGAYTAMFRHDLKGLLAYSTISHLGLITLMFGLSTPLATVAGVFHIMNHATFKASLFMAAGIIDHETGSRDMRRLGNLWRYMPYTATLAMVAAAAMAGVPLLNGFLSKEMFFAEALEERLFGWVQPLAAAAAGMFSVAYSTRFIHDVFFHHEPRNLPRHPHEPPRWMKVPVEVLVVICIVVGVLPAWTVGPMLYLASASVIGAEPPAYSLAIWHGFNLPLAMSVVSLTGGAVLYLWLQHGFRLHAHIPGRRTAKRIFDRGAANLIVASGWITTGIENGSLQRYLAVTVFVALIVGVVPLLGSGVTLGPVSPTPADGVSIVVLLALTVAVVGAVAFRRQHLRSVIFVSVAGLIVSLAFLRFSAPDLALTQLSVEVVSIILLLLALRRLPARSPGESSAGRLARDGVLAALSGLALGLLTFAVLSRPLASISPFFLEESLPGGGGSNVVNVILVDFRGFDTFGEIIVLAIAAIGVLTITAGLASAIEQPTGDDTPGHGVAGESLILAVAARVLLPLSLLVAVYLLLRGHNDPGGGFIAGLVTAIALVIQYMASGLAWAQRRFRLEPRPITAWGVLIAGLTGLGSLAFGYPFLTSTYDHVHPPLIGDVELASAMVFDLGVYLAVVGATLTYLTMLSRVPAPPKADAPGEEV